MGLEKEYYIKSAQRGAFCDRGSDIADEGENDIRMTRSFLYSKQRMRSTPRSRFWTVVLLCWRTFAASCLVLAPSKQDFIVGYCKSSSNQLSKNGCCSGSSSKGSTWSSRTLASKLFVSGYGCRLSAQIMCRQRRGRVRWVRMDDEIARHGIKEELTTRDEYLATRFTKLSVSGHDLTPLTPRETQDAVSHLSPGVRAALFGGASERRDGTPASGGFRDNRERGMYACAVGGLPLFTSGWKMEPRAADDCPSFAEPCDAEHLIEQQDEAEGVTYILCARSGIRVGTVVDDAASPTGRRYLLKDAALEFHPLGKPLPVRSQPENYWGSEGQYRAWQFSE